MVLFRETFFTGLRRAANLWLLLPLYLTSLVLGLIQTWPLWRSGVISNPLLDRIVTGGSDALVRVALADTNATAQIGGGWVGSVLLLTVVYSLAYAIFSGGILSRFADTRSFWGGCAHYAFSFVGLALILFIPTALVIALATGVGVALGSVAGIVAGLVLLQLVNLWGEYARAVAVANNRRNPFVLLGRSFMFVVRHLPGTVGLALVGILLTAAVSVIYGAVSSPLESSPLAVLVQQTAVIGWLWVKLLRLAWALSYVEIANRPAVIEPFGVAAPVVI